MITEKMLQLHAANAVANEMAKSNKPRMLTIASFVMLAVIAKHDSGVDLVKVTNDKREMAIKSLMRAEGFINGSSATYSKVANGLLSKLIATHGSPMGGKDGVSQFWADWRDAPTISKREAMVTNLYLQMQGDAGGRFMDLCDCFEVSCEGNKTWQVAQDAKAEKADKPKAEKAKTIAPEVVAEVKERYEAKAGTWQDVLADMLALSATDQASLIAAYQEAMFAKAKDVSPVPQQIAA